MTAAPRILVLCTANRCRSPLAAALIARALPQAHVSSAGFMDAGQPVPARGIEIAASLGLDVAAHRSTLVTPASLRAADLILTAARVHLREAVTLEPQAWPRAFTLKQFARWWDDREVPATMPARPWWDVEAASRSRLEMIGDSPVDDLRDPFGASARVWRSVVAEMSTAIDAGLGWWRHGSHVDPRTHPRSHPVPERRAVEEGGPLPA